MSFLSYDKYCAKFHSVDAEVWVPQKMRNVINGRFQINMQYNWIENIYYYECWKKSIFELRNWILKSEISYFWGQSPNNPKVNRMFIQRLSFCTSAMLRHTHTEIYIYIYIYINLYIFLIASLRKFSIWTKISILLLLLF